MDNYQQQIDELYKSHKRLFKCVIISFIVLMSLIVYMVFSTTTPVYNDHQLKLSIDSMRTHDRDRVLQVSRLENQNQQWGNRITAIDNKVDNVPIMISAIKHKYDIQRTHITTLTADEQLELFTSWLSQADSL